MGNSEIVQSSWFVLSLTGSLTGNNTFVRKYSNQSYRGGVFIGKRKDPASPIQLNEYWPNDSLLSDKRENISRTIKRRKKKRRINPQITSQVLDQVIECQSEKIDQKIVEDSPRMREFFKEVQRRELKQYYRQMMASQRMRSDPSPVCPDWDLAKLTETDITHNVYCRGPHRLC